MNCEFDHRCDEMPYDVDFCKFEECSSQFTVSIGERGAFTLKAALYGFRYCPYCGEDMEAKR